MVAFTKRVYIKRLNTHPKCQCEEGMIEFYPVPRKRSKGFMICLIVTMVIVVASTLGTGAVAYYRNSKDNSTHRHYQGYCAISPSGNREDTQPMYQTLHVLPLAVSSDSNVRIVNLLSENSSDELANPLREELHIDGSVEKISVFDNGRRVDFIHDFEANFTGIVDQERCFVMELDPETVLAPWAVAAGEQRFEVSRVLSRVRASLPALADLSLGRGVTFFLDHCLQRPLYRLHKDDAIVIRKRSAEEHSHGYIVFSGKHVQEIEVTNLQELLQEEHLAKASRSAT